MNFFQNLASTASEKASDVSNTVGNTVGAPAGRVLDAVGDTAIGKELFALKERLARQAEQFKEEKLQMLKEFEEEKRRFILGYIQGKLEGFFDHGMNIAAEKLKESIKDPYMPGFVQNWCDDLVDGIWPDVKMELKDEILKGFGSKVPIHHNVDPSCCLLAFFRYQLLPYDRGFWRQLRNPWWWLFTLLSLVPKYGVVQIVYALQFIMIDKSDEFQLFQFIVQFKALQFLTVGIVGSLVGSVQYYICVSASPPNCDEWGPKESFWTMLLFCLQVVIIFVAFLLMNCSEKKGGFYYQLEQESRAKLAQKAQRGERMNVLNELSRNDIEMKEGDRLMHAMHYKSETAMLEDSRWRMFKYMIYDLFIFLICVGLVLWMVFGNLLSTDATVTKNGSGGLTDSNWKFVMGLFWIKIFYGFMSFPFVLLKLPLLSTLISHARPTGYNPY